MCQRGGRVVKPIKQLISPRMMEKAKKSDIYETLKHSKNYFFADIAIKAVGVISVPIFSRLLTQEDYGIVAVFDAYVGIFLIILSLNSHAAVGRYYYEKTKDFNEFVGTTLIFMGFIFAFIALFFISLSKQIAHIIQLPGLLHIYLVIICLFGIICEMYIEILIPQKRSREIALIRTVRSFASVATSILLVCLLKENKYLGRVWASLIIGAIFSVYLMIKIRDYSRFSFRRSHLSYIAHYSFPLVPYALSGIILAHFDRIMINSTLGTASAGLYSLGYNIGMLLLIVIASTRTALIPDFYRFLNSREYNRLEILVRRVFSIVTIAALGLFLFAMEIGFILADEKFHPGLSVVPIVVIGYVFFGMYSIYSWYVFYEKRTSYLSVVVFPAGVLNIVLNILFIPKYGYIAAAYTTVVSYFVMFLLMWITANRICDQRIVPLWIIWKPTIIMFLFIGSFYYLNWLNLHTVVFFIMKLMILVLFSTILFWKEIKILYSEMFRT